MCPVEREYGSGVGRGGAANHGLSRELADFFDGTRSTLLELDTVYLVKMSVWLFTSGWCVG